MSPMSGWWTALAAGVLLTVPTMGYAEAVLLLEQPIQGIEAFQVHVAGQAGLYLFDSGLGTSGITPATAHAIGCVPWGKVTGFRATGERVDAERCNAATLEAGPIARRMPQLTVLELERFMGPVGRRFAGAVGLDAFDGKVITLSVASHSITVEDASSEERIARTGTEVPIRLVRAAEGAALTADIGVTTRSGLLWMEIDTGNYGPSLIDKRAAPLLALDTAATVPQPVRAPVAKGTQLGGQAVVRDLIMDGDLGRGALKDWDVTLDLTHGRGWIRRAINVRRH
jgi:hypothetical protein